jgi:hypothetical protein
VDDFDFGDFGDFGSAAPDFSSDISFNTDFSTPDFSMPSQSMDWSIPSALDPANTGGGGSSLLDSWNSLTGLGKLGAGLGLGTAGLGLAGALQQAIQGNPNPTTPGQRAAVNQSMQSQQFGQSAGTSLLSAMQGLTPLQMQAAGQGLQGQMGLLNAFNPQMMALAQGNLPFSPQIQSLVQQAYQPQFMSAMQQATNAGRQAGFYDAPTAGGPGGNVLGQLMPQLAGQEAQAQLNLATQMPGMVGQAVQNYQPLTNAFNQAGQGQSGVMNAIAGNSDVGNLARVGTKAQPTNLLQTMNQTAPILGGIGGLLAGVSALSGRPTY